MKFRLRGLAHAYCGNAVDIGDFLIIKYYILESRSIRCNENIRVAKPDKDSGVVIMNKSDYISKMHFILQDSFKFENLGPSSKIDNTAKIEAHIEKRESRFMTNHHNKKIFNHCISDLMKIGVWGYLIAETHG